MLMDFGFSFMPRKLRAMAFRPMAMDFGFMARNFRPMLIGFGLEAIGTRAIKSGQNSTGMKFGQRRENSQTRTYSLDTRLMMNAEKASVSPISTRDEATKAA